jgi:hypothetical protein
MADGAPTAQDSLRSEHDGLARLLEARASVDVARNGFVVLFGGILFVGVGWALVWDRYDRLDLSDPGLSHPIAFLTGAAVAALAGLVLIARGALVLRRSRRMAREEAVLFRRLLELRRLLGIDE